MAGICTLVASENCFDMFRELYKTKIYKDTQNIWIFRDGVVFKIKKHVRNPPCRVGDRGSLIPRPSGTPFQRGTRDDGKGVRVVLRDWERQHPTGLGARATADMTGKRPLCALGPMMSALILWFVLIKKNEQ